jgi:hypothetical protein
MEQAESNSDSPRVFTREKRFVQLGMAACGIGSCFSGTADQIWVMPPSATSSIPVT